MGRVGQKLQKISERARVAANGPRVHVRRLDEGCKAGFYPPMGENGECLAVCYFHGRSVLCHDWKIQFRYVRCVCLSRISSVCVKSNLTRWRGRRRVCTNAYLSNRGEPTGRRAWELYLGGNRPFSLDVYTTVWISSTHMRWRSIRCKRSVRRKWSSGGALWWGVGARSTACLIGVADTERRGNGRRGQNGTIRGWLTGIEDVMGENKDLIGTDIRGWEREEGEKIGASGSGVIIYATTSDRGAISGDTSTGVNRGMDRREERTMNARARRVLGMMTGGIWSRENLDHLQERGVEGAIVAEGDRDAIRIAHSRQIVLYPIVLVVDRTESSLVRSAVGQRWGSGNEIPAHRLRSMCGRTRRSDVGIRREQALSHDTTTTGCVACLRSRGISCISLASPRTTAGWGVSDTLSRTTWARYALGILIGNVIWVKDIHGTLGMTRTNTTKEPGGGSVGRVSVGVMQGSGEGVLIGYPRVSRVGDGECCKERRGGAGGHARERSEDGDLARTGVGKGGHMRPHSCGLWSYGLRNSGSCEIPSGRRGGRVGEEHRAYGDVTTLTPEERARQIELAMFESDKFTIDAALSCVSWVLCGGGEYDTRDTFVRPIQKVRWVADHSSQRYCSHYASRGHGRRTALEGTLKIENKTGELAGTVREQKTVGGLRHRRVFDTSADRGRCRMRVAGERSREAKARATSAPSTEEANGCLGRRQLVIRDGADEVGVSNIDWEGGVKRDTRRVLIRSRGLGRAFTVGPLRTGFAQWLSRGGENLSLIYFRTHGGARHAQSALRAGQASGNERGGFGVSVTQQDVESLRRDDRNNLSGYCDGNLYTLSRLFIWKRDKICTMLERNRTDRRGLSEAERVRLIERGRDSLELESYVVNSDARGWSDHWKEYGR
ncbi:hypothetical protein Tco_1042529 [Tanacetum coccineum]|uniref:Uncharacterized protein n=1 Tax=Tanacetum coccineum TaxID=301880 RepID=A0ABQ5GK42_9ASTR